jgi:hypothetical protein
MDPPREIAVAWSNGRLRKAPRRFQSHPLTEQPSNHILNHMGTTPPPSTAIAKRKKNVGSLSPRKRALLWAERMDRRTEHLVLDAVGCGASQKMSAEAGGLTLPELQYIFKLAEDGHPAYRDFRDDYFQRHTEHMLEVVQAQHRAATSDEGSIADRRFALELHEPETFKDAAAAKGGVPAGGAYQANHYTFNVKTSWDDDELGEEPAVVDAEDVEVVG